MLKAGLVGRWNERAKVPVLAKKAGKCDKFYFGEISWQQYTSASPVFFVN
jgi:hypothetical protein